MILRNVTAIVIALLVLMLGVRPLSKALMKKRDDAGRGAIGRDLGATFGIGSPMAPGTGPKTPASAQLATMPSTACGNRHR